MEREWILFWKVVFGFYLGNLWIVFGFLIFLIQFVVFVIGFGVVVVVVVVVIFVFSVIFGWKKKISIEIGIEYNRYRMIILQKICKYIDENCGLIIIKLVDKVIDDVFFKCI